MTDTIKTLILMVVLDQARSQFLVYHVDSPSIISVENSTNDVFVGGRNVLLHFNKRLELISALSTGPVPDTSNLTCELSDKTCLNVQNIVDYFTSVLNILSNRRILRCGTGNNGLCYVHDGRNISDFDPFKTDSFNDFRLTSLLGSHSNKRVVSVTNTNQYDECPQIFHTRTCHSIIYTMTESELKPHGFGSSYSFSTLSVVPEHNLIRDLGSQYRSYLNMKKNYTIFTINIFQDEKYVLFVYKVTGQEQTDIRPTKIGVICKDDVTYESFVEIPLVCDSEMMKHRHGRVSSYDPSLKTLYISFDDNNMSTICAYQHDDIINAMNIFVCECKKGLQFGKMPWSDSPDGKERCSKSTDSKLTCKDSCTEKLGGITVLEDIERENLPATSLFLKNNSQINMIHATTKKGITTIIYGTKQGCIALITNMTGKFENERYKCFENQSISLGRYNTDDEENVFVMTNKMVIKVPTTICEFNTNCGECVSHPMRCQWCNGVCLNSEGNNKDCLTDFCPPEELKVFPKTIPSKGEVKLTLEGKYLGDQFSTTVTDKFGDKCKILEQQHDGDAFHDRLNIECKLKNEQNNSANTFLFLVHVNESVIKNKYKEDLTIRGNTNISVVMTEISLNHITPTKGPSFGNTPLTIYGQNLYMNQSVSITVAKIPCDIVSLYPDQIVCTTQPWININPKAFTEEQNKTGNCLATGSIDVHIANESYIFDQKFCYFPAPIITTVKPTITIASGGIKAIVIGDNFEWLQNISLELKGQNCNVSVGNECWVINAKEMHCFYPKIKFNLTKPEQISLIVYSKTLKNPFEKTLTAYQDPEFYSISTIAKDDSHIIIVHGSGFDSSLPKNVFNVTVSNVSCDIQKIQPTKITCLIQHYKYDLMKKNHPLAVTVKIGNLNKTLGDVYFNSGERPSNMHLYALGIVFIVVIFAVLILIALRIKRKWCGQRKYPFENRLGSEVQTFQNLLRIENDEGSTVPNDYTPIGQDDNPSAISNSDLEQLLRNEKLHVSRDNITLAEQLGHGNFGCVYKAYLREDGSKEEKTVAVKTLLGKSTAGPSASAEFLEEALIMKNLDHPNVLKLIGVVTEAKEFPLVILEYMENGDLLSYIRNEQNKIVVKNLVKFGCDVAKGMVYLSSIKFVHRDLAARNCMLDGKLKVHIADFGLSRDIYSNQYYKLDARKKVPVKWMAPESLDITGIYTVKSDVWSFGVLLWELLTRGAQPYNEVDSWDMLRYLQAGRRLKKPAYCPELIYELMLNCWNINPNMRPCFSHIEQELQSCISSNRHQRQKGKQKGGIDVDMDSTTSAGEPTQDMF